MDTATINELIGYLASGLIVLSLLMSSVLRLRIIGLFGATAFTTYGLLIGALPIALANGAIIFIHVFHLTRMLRDRSSSAYFETMQVPADSPMLHRFVEFHLDDIRRFQPGFPGLGPDQLALLVLRNAVPVGAVVSEVHGDVAEVVLDYVSPEHRDLRPGTFVWSDSDAFTARGVTKVVTTARTSEHARYLERVGFTHDEDGRYTRSEHAPV